MRNQPVRIYFDNAATTPLDPTVLEAMMPYFTDKFGNPSSIYSYGRESRLAIENARKSVAKLLNAHPGEIFFTSCGTESNNTAILSSIRDLGCKHIITSPIEHHAVLHTVEHYDHANDVKIKPFVFGGGQERNMRAGTENLYGIVGFAKALEIAMMNYEKDRAFIQVLKSYMMDQLRKNIKGIVFNGDAEGKCLYTVLS